jgi:hypothetical protein
MVGLTSTKWVKFTLLDGWSIETGILKPGAKTPYGTVVAFFDPRVSRSVEPSGILRVFRVVGSKALNSNPNPKSTSENNLHLEDKQH